MGDQIIIVPKIVLPLEEAKQYTIDIKIKEEEREQSIRSNRPKNPKTMRLLVENSLVKPGDPIFLKNGLPGYIRYDESDPTFQATITGKLGQSDAVLWTKDGSENSISALTWSIFKSLHPEQKDPGGINGNWHWVDANGRSLWEIAEEFRDRPAA